MYGWRRRGRGCVHGLSSCGGDVEFWGSIANQVPITALIRNAYGK